MLRMTGDHVRLVVSGDGPLSRSKLYLQHKSEAHRGLKRWQKVRLRGREQRWSTSFLSRLVLRVSGTLFVGFFNSKRDVLQFNMIFNESVRRRSKLTEVNRLSKGRLHYIPFNSNWNERLR